MALQAHKPNLTLIQDNVALLNRKTCLLAGLCETLAFVANETGGGDEMTISLIEVVADLSKEVAVLTDI